MNYLNLKITDLTSPAFLGTDPVNRATWLCLMRYCAQHETGGRIEEAAGWGDRKWQQLCGVLKKEVENVCELWSWGDDGSLIVHLYPKEQEDALNAKREAGRRSQKRHMPGHMGGHMPGHVGVGNSNSKGNSKGKGIVTGIVTEKKQYTLPASMRSSEEKVFSTPAAYAAHFAKLCQEYVTLEEEFLIKRRPQADIRLELDSMVEWLNENPAKAAKRKNPKLFVESWLARSRSKIVRFNHA